MDMNRSYRGIVIFSHGKEGHPAGGKIVAMQQVAAEMGYRTESLDYRGLSLVDREQILTDRLSAINESAVLVGSSMGGYLSVIAATRFDIRGVFLLAPAIGMGHYPQPQPDVPDCPIEVVHGYNDQVVQPDAVIAWCRAGRVPLHLVDDEHRLLASLPQICSLFRNFLTPLTVEQSR